MPKLTRQEVRASVDTEAKFSSKWDENRPADDPGDAAKSVETWLAYIHVYLEAALKAATVGYDKTAALQNLRCILNLGEACAQHHGLPPRAEGDSTDIY